MQASSSSRNNGSWWNKWTGNKGDQSRSMPDCMDIGNHKLQSDTNPELDPNEKKNEMELDSTRSQTDAPEHVNLSIGLSEIEVDNNKTLESITNMEVDQPSQDMLECSQQKTETTNIASSENNKPANNKVLNNNPRWIHPWKDGDKTCQKCGLHLFAARRTCPQCDKPWTNKTWASHLTMEWEKTDAPRLAPFARTNANNKDSQSPFARELHNMTKGNQDEKNKTLSYTKVGEFAYDKLARYTPPSLLKTLHELEPYHFDLASDDRPAILEDHGDNFLYTTVAHDALTNLYSIIKDDVTNKASSMSNNNNTNNNKLTYFLNPPFTGLNLWTTSVTSALSKLKIDFPDVEIQIWFITPGSYEYSTSENFFLINKNKSVHHLRQFSKRILTFQNVHFEKINHNGQFVQIPYPFPLPIHAILLSTLNNYANPSTLGMDLSTTATLKSQHANSK